MRNNLFEKPKEVFLDVVDPKDYVQLERISTIYQSLKDSVKKPLKMILLYGKPGTGKSMLLNKLYQDLSRAQKVVLYQSPILDDSEFLRSLAKDVYHFAPDDAINFTNFMTLTDKFKHNTTPIVLLDEAQLYSDNQMEKIRLLSDSRKIKFVVTLHKTEQEDLIAKEHFQTRIWESIELINASPAELKIYIQKKLMKANCFDIANMFNEKNIKTIFNSTQGKYRDSNKLLYTLFQILAWYEENQPTKIDYSAISKKHIEMAAIHTGLLHA
jgi:type II secretory pathway predicted ATPase ExeA